VIAALLALAAAVHSPTGFGTPNDDDWPPVRYRGNVGAYVHFTTQFVITAKCDAGDPDPPDLYTVACAWGPPNELYLPNPCWFPKTDSYARIVCHEMGHLNGWPDNHPAQ